MTSERKAKMDFVLNNRQPDLVVLLENIEDPHNVSAVMRTCDAVGIQDVYVLNTGITHHRKFGHKSSGSAKLWVTPHQFDNLDECIAAIRTRVNKIYATHLTEQASSVYDLDLTEPVAFAFGNERLGISANLLARCDGNVLVPQVGMIRSLNISVACAVIVYEAFRQRSGVGLYHSECRLPQHEVAALKENWKYRE